jgi:outer membrane receptor protein involved in Fe transport
MVGRVDVFKPPAPVWLGAGGTAGAINIVLTDQAPKLEEKQKNSRIGILGGSFGQAGLADFLRGFDSRRLHHYTVDNPFLRAQLPGGRVLFLPSYSK